MRYLPARRQARVGEDLVAQLRCRAVAALSDLTMEELDQAARKLFPIDDELPQAPGMKHDMHGVSGARIVHLVGLVEGTEQPSRGVVPHPDVPSSVDHDPGIGFLLAENELQRPLDVLQVEGVEVALAERRGIACCEM
jgi:hypothetical protein